MVQKTIQGTLLTWIHLNSIRSLCILQESQWSSSNHSSICRQQPHHIKLYRSGNTKQERSELSFQMMDLGEIHWILNMEVTRDCQRCTISLSQSQYIENILERHGMAKCKLVSTPMEANLRLKKLDAAEMNTTEYQQPIGSLMYGSIGTRFDITYDVGVLSCHNHSPGN